MKNCVYVYVFESFKEKQAYNVLPKSQVDLYRVVYRKA